jgi:hypothetical protein
MGMRGGFGGRSGATREGRPGRRPSRGEQFAQRGEKPLNRQQGVPSAAEAPQLGDDSEYLLDQPVSLPRQKSALLPVVRKGIPKKIFDL